jgi:hypothetical protein
MPEVAPPSDLKNLDRQQIVKLLKGIILEQFLNPEGINRLGCVFLVEYGQTLFQKGIRKCKKSDMPMFVQW